jgi:glycosidase
MPGEERVKMAGGVMAMMNGGCFVYYGEEIGMLSKGGNNSDPAKRIAMKWKEKNIYEGCCFISPENTPVDETSYLYPSVEEQQADANSILNYYKRAMQLRNMFPSIARGTVENFSPEDNSYICVITKTYGDEKITIVYNLDEWDQTITLDAGIGCSEIVGDLYVDNSKKAEYKDGTLTLPPYSIVILK